MMNDVMSSVVQIDAEELQNLVAEVKETVATVVHLPKAKQKKSFGHVDMWNIRKNAKSASDMLRRR
jgi:hypothetical protein